MGQTDTEKLKEAKKVARKADKVVVVIGLTFLEESEGFDRENYSIAPGHLQLLETVIDANPNVIVVLQNGSPVAMPWIDRVDGVVEAYLGGQAGGRALADVLTGKVNPSGKLAETFPIKIEDNPTYVGWAGEEGASYYNEGVFVGYRYYDKKKVEPLFPFGFGLSYTTFEFADINVDRTSLSENDTVNISVSVKNTGKVFGKEVVQLYVKDLEASVGRPEKELKHFAKISLKPGEQKDVSFQLSNRDFAFYSARHEQWITETGDFTILVGSSSRNLPLQKNVTLSVQNPPKEVFTRYSLMKSLKGHPVGEKIMADIKSNLFGSFGGDGTKKNLSEAEQVNLMKTSLMLEKLLEDMPIKNIVQFSAGKVTEADLEQMLAGLNQ